MPRHGLKSSTIELIFVQKTNRFFLSYAAALAPRVGWSRI